MTAKLIGWLALALVVAFGGGWLLGASGKGAVEQQRRALEERADLAEARAAMLDGRVSLFLVNFGDASRRFSAARAVVERVQIQFRETGRAEAAGQLEVVIAHLKDAERLSLSLDASAQNAADQALQALATVGSK